MLITQLSQLDLTKQYTYADYLAWRIEERLELIKGWVMRMSAPSIAHQTIQMELILEMGTFFRNHPCRFLAAPVDVCLTRKGANDTSIKTVVQPDLLVVCDLEKIKMNRNVMGAPDLVVEILSPGNTKKEMKQKYEVYEENSVREYWLVHPTEKYAVIHSLQPDGKFRASAYFTDDDILVSPLFPELHINLSLVFKNV